MLRPTPQSYLLRLWREHQTAPVRITLVAVGLPDVRRHFSTLAECFAWLNHQADGAAEAQVVLAEGAAGVPPT